MALDPHDVIAGALAANHGGQTEAHQVIADALAANHPATAPLPPGGVAPAAPVADPAAPGAAPPPPPPASGERINVIDPDGKLVSLPSSNLDAAVKAGYRPETHEAATARRADDYVKAKDAAGTGTGASFYKSFEDQALMGVPGTVDAYADSEGTKASKEALDEAHPIAHYAGAALGFGLNAAATAGAGLALRGTSLATRILGETAAKTVATTVAESAARSGTEAIAERALLGGASNVGESAAAEAATKAAAEGASTAVAQTIGQKAASAALHSAGIGAAYAVPQAVVHLANNNPTGAAETVLMGAGIGAITGGALAGATGLVAARRALRMPGAGPAAGAIEASLQKTEAGLPEKLQQGLDAIHEEHASGDSPLFGHDPGEPAAAVESGAPAPTEGAPVTEPSAAGALDAAGQPIPDESGVLPKTPDSGKGIAGEPVATAPAEGEPTSGVEAAADVAKDAGEEALNNEAQDAAGVGERAEASPDAPAMSPGGKPTEPWTVQRIDKAKDALIQHHYGHDEETLEAARRIYKQGGHSLERDQDALKAAARKAVEEGNVSLRLDDRIRQVAFGEGKARQMAKLVPEHLLGQQIDQTATAFERARALVTELKAAGDSGINTDLNRLEKYIDYALEGKGSKTEAPGAPGELTRILQGRGRNMTAHGQKMGADLFMAQDYLKRMVGKVAGFGQNFQTPAQAKIEKELYNVMMGELESPEVWGKAGDAQRVQNLATTKFLESAKQFSSEFAVTTKSVAGHNVNEFNPAKLGAILAEPDALHHDLPNRYLAERRTGQLGQIEALEATHPALDPETRALFREAKSAAKRFDETIETARREARIFQKGQAIAASGKLEEPAKPLTSRVLGWLPAVGRGLEDVSSTGFRQHDIGFNPRTKTPFSNLQALAALRKTAGDFHESLDGLHGARVGAETIGKSLDHVIKAVAKAPDIFTGKTVRASDVSTQAKTYAKFLGVPLKNMASTKALTVEQYRGVQDHLNAVTSDPSHDAHTAAKGMQGALHEVNPKVATAYGDKLSGMMTYLHKALPPEPISSNPFLPADPTPPSPSQLQEFSDKLRVCMDPTSVYHSVREGSLTDAEMDAVSANYPDILAAMRQTTHEWAAGNPKAAQSLRPAQLDSLGKFLGMNMQGDGDPNAAAFFQGKYASADPTAKPPAAQGPAPAGGRTAPAKFTVPDVSTSIGKVSDRGGQ